MERLTEKQLLGYFLPGYVLNSTMKLFSEKEIPQQLLHLSSLTGKMLPFCWMEIWMMLKESDLEKERKCEEKLWRQRQRSREGSTF